jgi:hypothetical protein
MIIEDIEKFKTTDLPLEETRFFIEIVKFLKNFYLDEEVFAARYNGVRNENILNLLSIYNPANDTLQFGLHFNENRKDPYIETNGFPVESSEIFDLDYFEEQLNYWIEQANEYIELQEQLSDDYSEEDAIEFDKLFSKSKKKDRNKLLTLADQEKVEKLLIDLTQAVNEIPNLDEERKENILKYIENTIRLLPSTKKGAIRERIIKIFSKIKKLGIKTLTYAGKKFLESASKKASDSVIDDVVSVIKDTF